MDLIRPDVTGLTAVSQRALLGATFRRAAGVAIGGRRLSEVVVAAVRGGEGAAAAAAAAALEAAAEAWPRHAVTRTDRRARFCTQRRALVHIFLRPYSCAQSISSNMISMLMTTLKGAGCGT